MHWLFVVLAGLFEIGWSISSKKTQGYTELIWMIPYVLFGLGSSVCLTLSAKVLPLAVAYGIWKGVALLGTSAADVLVFRDSFSWLRAGSIGLILLGVVGLGFSTNK